MSMVAASAFDLAPLLGIAGIGAAFALAVIAWFRARSRDLGPRARLHALTVLVLFLSFDLVLLGAFTRLSDSGLGCPDWPGCYGHVSPVGAAVPIGAAEAAMPSGAVTPHKAWIEMAHRYSATVVGMLIALLALLAWLLARRGVGVSPRWAVVTLFWVALQGAFGALTVSMRLNPAIVTLHLLGGLGLLALLAVQAESYAPRRLVLDRGLHAGLVAVAALAVVQIALGGWVSTNYAVLACRDFPTCQGQWWPDMNFAAGFVVDRGLGTTGDGGYLPFQALTAIHVAHRLGAVVLLPALLALAWCLRSRSGAARPWAAALLAIALWQAASGLGNVLLGWPLASALAHTAGSAALVVVLATLLARASRPANAAEASAPSAARGAPTFVKSAS